MINFIPVVLGGYINGFSIIRELYDEDIKNIVLLDYGSSISRYSNKVAEYHKIDRTPESLKSKLLELNSKYGNLVLYPTDDIQLELLNSIYNDIESFCFIPFNPINLVSCLDKNYQYDVCQKFLIPFPRSIRASQVEDIVMGENLTFPLIIKPSQRKDLSTNVFRTLFIKDLMDYKKKKKLLVDYINHEIEFVISEFIPGDDTNIYAYTCFRGSDGKIYNEWVGKKLTQFPDEYGIFSSASNEAPDIIFEQGRKLVKALDLYGIVEPEFKYDYRDGQFKLMEVNLRSMMWHRVGNLSGVKLHKTQFDFATGKSVKLYEQERDKLIHFVLMQHEVANLIARPGYFKHFKNNIFSGSELGWAVFDKRDLIPFFASFWVGIKYGIKACLSRLKTTLN
ncbi:hypothetical protein [Pseudoalteromonas sp. Ps84H-4]|uniref:hypothetical protein n=1 Tax=Pseudoalteromonas sp. Ps84H-4 TaxID=2954502 RepID=UPI00209841BE|nr:hypothetical protein [Pseudoalteromonas sp. Ps84H-4]MCO7251753.1 hypothetical protein [Pseudoalteromonas sp. Ps84H-4]